MSIFTGAGVALVTPMKENLEVNYDKLDEILQRERMRLLFVERPESLQLYLKKSMQM